MGRGGGASLSSRSFSDLIDPPGSYSRQWYTFWCRIQKQKLIYLEPTQIYKLMRNEIWWSMFYRFEVIWFVSIDFIENWVETTHDDIQYSPEWRMSRWWYFVSVASAKFLLTTRHFIPNRLTVRSGKIRYEIPYVRSSTGWPKYTIEPIILILVWKSRKSMHFHRDIILWAISWYVSWGWGY